MNSNGEPSDLILSPSPGTAIQVWNYLNVTSGYINQTQENDYGDWFRDGGFRLGEGIALTSLNFDNGSPISGWYLPKDSDRPWEIDESVVTCTIHENSNNDEFVYVENVNGNPVCRDEVTMYIRLPGSYFPGALDQNSLSPDVFAAIFGLGTGNRYLPNELREFDPSPSEGYADAFAYLFRYGLEEFRNLFSGEESNSDNIRVTFFEDNICEWLQSLLGNIDEE